MNIKKVIVKMLDDCPVAWVSIHVIFMSQAFDVVIIYFQVEITVASFNCSCQTFSVTTSMTKSHQFDLKRSVFLKKHTMQNMSLYFTI